MDKTTHSYYTTNAWHLLTRYASATDVNARHFGLAFPRHLATPFRVLDVGAGTGRDLLHLLDQGYDAYGIEPVEEMRNAALSQSTALSNRLLPGSLINSPLPASFTNDRFHGILCSAVLQHSERSQLLSACLRLKSLLLEKGRLFLSTPVPISSKAQAETDERDEHGRVFNRWHPEFLVLLFERLGFRLVDKWESVDGLGRANAGWNNFVFSLEGTEHKGGLERIEEIIFRDKKTSTYKLALVKALCEIAISGERDVHFQADGVHVPLRRISELWLRYYWPLLIETDHALPQNTHRQLAFQAELENLASHSGQRDLRILRSAAPGSEIEQRLETTLRVIGDTILKQPVQYAGNLSTVGRPFLAGRLDGARTVVVHPEVWRELVLFGRWLKDALVLEWSRWSANLAGRKDLSPDSVSQTVIRLLTQADEQARDTRIVRELFLREANSRRCTWTGRPVQNFDVDHILPYAHFGNNDLWNLVPASPSANNEKRDRAPSTALLEEARERLATVWAIEHSHCRTLFESHASRFTGSRNLFSAQTPWQSVLFDALWESVALWQAGGRERTWDGLHSA